MDIGIWPEPCRSCSRRCSLASPFQWPGAISGARLHGRENPHQTGTVAAVLQHLMNLVLLTEALRPADEFNFQRVLDRQAFGVLAQRLRPLDVVKDANVMSVEIPGHPFGKT